MNTSFYLIERDFVNGGQVINVGESPSFHSINPINTKHQETPPKNGNNCNIYIHIYIYINATRIFKEKPK